MESSELSTLPAAVAGVDVASLGPIEKKDEREQESFAIEGQVETAPSPAPSLAKNCSSGDAPTPDLQHVEVSHSSPSVHVRLYSDSSSVAGVALLGSAQTIDDPMAFEATSSEKDSTPGVNPLDVQLVQISTTNETSLPSAGPNPESFAAAALDEHHIQSMQPYVASLPNEAVPQHDMTGQSRGNDGPNSYVADLDMHPPQHLETMVPQTAPFLVAVPYQQASLEGMVQQNSQTPSLENDLDYIVNGQQTVLYQIPGVVTLPMGTTYQESQTNSVLSGENWVQLQQHQAMGQHLVQPTSQQDQIVGMMGSVPIVKLQGGTVHLVKKKKGRFKFLQDNPSQVSGTGGASATDQAGNAVGNTGAPVPGNMTVLSQSQSANSTVAQLSVGVPVVAQPPDGVSETKVKKKGRFVVTSVEDPIPKNIQPQNLQQQSGSLEVSPLAPLQQQHQQQLQTTSIQQQQQSTSSIQQQQQQSTPIQLQQSQQCHSSQPQYQSQQPPLHVQQQNFQPSQNSFQHAHVTPQPHYVYHHPIGMHPQEVVAHLSFPSTTFETPVSQQFSQHNNGRPVNDPSSYFAQQQYQHRPPPPPQHQQILQPPTGEQYQQQPLNALTDNQLLPPKSQPVSSSSTVPNGHESPGKSRQSVANVTLPHIPAKVQATGNNGMYGNISLGKLSHFLEQMKSEVEDTDRMIKHLQTDTKIMVSLVYCSQNMNHDAC
jgi:hypothetical protein